MYWTTIFDGIGTEIMVFIIGGLLGGFGGYNIGLRKNSNQKQVAGNKSNQRQKNQIIEADIISNDLQKINNKVIFEQYQEAGDESKQVQIGGVNVK